MKDLFLILGGAFICGTLYRIYQNVKFYRHSRVTTGRVIGWEKSERQPGFRHPLVEFNPLKNTVITFKSSVGMDREIYEIGDEVSVRYLSRDPKTAEINKKWVIWFDVSIFFAFAVAFTWMAIYFSRN